MLYWLIALAVVLALIAFVLTVSGVCYLKIFYSYRGKKKSAEEYPTPVGRIYDPYREQMVQWIKEIRAMKHTDASVLSFDGLTLRGKYYEYEKGAPIEILFHGYRGTSERDMCGAVHRCFHLGRNALLVDQRASGRSEGRVITFGVKESRDVQSWVQYVIENIDPNAKIIITGISMGAATVMTAASAALPKNVVGVLADCGYTSTEDIVKKVMRDTRLPATLLYPFARLGALLFGRFDPNESSPIASMKHCRLPIIFFHGDRDDFVPCYMSQENYDACASDVKRLVITKDAGHGLCFLKDTDGYFAEVEAFFDPILRD